MQFIVDTKNAHRIEIEFFDSPVPALEGVNIRILNPSGSVNSGKLVLSKSQCLQIASAFEAIARTTKNKKEFEFTNLKPFTNEKTNND